ncbi:MAG: hypothetical protein H7144_06305 [Burkholderiales bacterium]|nr:hypothetical protein [Phycisphaerae bacterium]
MLPPTATTGEGVYLRPERPQPVGGEQPRVKPLAVYAGTVTGQDGTARPFRLEILTEAAGTVTATIPGPHGPIKIAGTRTGDTYNLSTPAGDKSVAVVAKVDAAGNVTGTVTRTHTENGETQTHIGTLALKKVEIVPPPIKPGPRPDPAAKPIASYNGSVTENGVERKFNLAILTEGADGAVTANIPGPGHPIKLTGTKAGGTYTLGATLEHRTIALTATVDASGNVTGTITTVITKPDSTTETHTGTLALKKVVPPVKPTTPDSGATTGLSSTASTTALGKSTTIAKPNPTPTPRVKPAPGTITNLLTYTGKMSIGDRSGTVVIRTYTDSSNGKTFISIRSRALLGKRSLVMEATITGNTISASRSDGERSATISLTTSADGSLVGSLTLKRGTVERTMTIDADKVTSV